MKNFLYIAFAFLLFEGWNTKKDKDWQTLDTVEDLWNYQPEHLRTLFRSLDFDQNDLEPIKTALASGDSISAAKELLEYYQNLNRNWIVTTLDDIPYNEALRQANALLENHVIRQGKEYTIPTKEKGGWQWDYTGPDQDDEFGYSLNGHKYLPSLYLVWSETSEAKYLQVFDNMVRDWIVHHPLSSISDSVYMVLDPKIKLDYRDIGEVEWRTLETGHRLGASWPQMFYALQKVEAFSPSTRLMILASLVSQSNFLMKYHKSGHNWTTMEMNGLALAGLSFPEFKESTQWANYAQEVMKKEINRQVYPDGLQTEISSKTQWVALNRFETLASNFAKANQPMSEEYINRVKQMYDYLAYSMRPDGHQPLNNDSDRDGLKPRVLKAASKFNKPDWKWIATNGQDGVLPDQGPSLTFPWAGIHIMRSGWNEQADWSFFDAGPYGTGHQHRDKLHLSVSVKGYDILVDGGRYTHKDYFNFDPSAWRGYFRSSYSHNVILVEGNGQKAGPTRTDRPLIENEDYLHSALYDYAYGEFTDGFENVDGEIVHSRSVLYIKENCWIVLDRFQSDEPRNIQALWHYAPGNKVQVEGSEAVSTNDHLPNLRIIPLGDVSWSAEIIEGQEKPVIQGWYSSVFGEKVTNPTVVYSARIEEPKTFGWLLYPSEGEVPKISAEFSLTGQSAIIKVSHPEMKAITATLPIEKNLPIVKVQQ
ncbi:MAG: alginate lyase family protein [Cyclobacteriaceae bacterium]